MSENEYTIDATDKKLGRIATEAASYLINKDRTDFNRATKTHAVVNIVNASQMDIPDHKKYSKKYKWFTGWPSGLKERRMDEMITRKGYGEILKIAVFGMLPKNKSRKKIIQQLKVID